jgi:Rrf2 family protein
VDGPSRPNQDWCGPVISHEGQTGAEVQTSPGIAARTGIPEPTVAKVLKSLSAAALVTSQRGARGGYRLVRPLEDVPVGEVIAAMDGPIALAACVDGSPTECESLALCPVRGRWDPVNDAIQRALSAISLADMREAAIPPVFRVPHTATPHPAAAHPANVSPEEPGRADASR